MTLEEWDLDVLTRLSLSLLEVEEMETGMCLAPISGHVVTKGGDLGEHHLDRETQSAESKAIATEV